MKAVVIERPHEVAFVEVDTPSPGPGDVLVRSHVAGVCRTDLEMLHGGLTDPRWSPRNEMPGLRMAACVARAPTTRVSPHFRLPTPEGRQFPPDP